MSTYIRFQGLWYGNEVDVEEAGIEDVISNMINSEFELVSDEIINGNRLVFLNDCCGTGGCYVTTNPAAFPPILDVVFGEP